MILADIVFSTGALTVVGAVVSTLAGSIAMLFKLVIKSHVREIKGLVAERESYKGIAKDSMRHLEMLVNQNLTSRGLPPLTPMAPVVAEHQSPATEQAQEVAVLATLRARLVATEKVLGIGPAT